MNVSHLQAFYETNLRLIWDQFETYNETNLRLTRPRGDLIWDLEEISSSVSHEKELRITLTLITITIRKKDLTWISF